MTTDDSKAALAAALADSGLMRRYSDYAAHVPTMQDTTDFHALCQEWAAAILAAMPNWRLVPADAVPVDAEQIVGLIRSEAMLLADDWGLGKRERLSHLGFAGGLAARVRAALVPAPSEP